MSRMTIRVSPQDRVAWEECARVAEVELSEWIRRSLNAAAEIDPPKPMVVGRPPRVKLFEQPGGEVFEQPPKPEPVNLCPRCERRWSAFRLPPIANCPDCVRIES